MSEQLSRQQNKIQPGWWSKTLAGVILGLFLSYGLVALFAWFGPDNLTTSLSNERALWRVQFNMWLITPIWLCVIAFVYLFKSGKVAWLKLGLANVFIYSVWVLLRSTL